MFHNVAVKFLRLSIIVLCLTSALAAAAAEADIAGGWMVEFALPWGGTANYPMWVIQEGSRLTGRVTFPGVGEYPLKGTIEDDRFRIVWQTNVDGDWTDIVFVGTIKGETISGSARIGKYAEGELYGRRTERP